MNALDAKLVNEAFLSGDIVEVWRTYPHRFGRGDVEADELMGSGRIVKHTIDAIMLDDGQHYPKAGAEIRIKQK